MLHLQPTLVGASKPKSASANARHRWVESNSFKLWPWGCILSNRIEWKIKAWKLCRGCREPLNELRPFTPYLSFTFLSRNLNDYNRHIIDVYIYTHKYIYMYINIHIYIYRHDPDICYDMLRCDVDIIVILLYMLIMRIYFIIVPLSKLT